MAAAAAPMVNCRRVICMLSPVGEWMASSAALSRRPGSIEADVQFLDQRMPAGDLLLYEPAELLRRGCEWLHAKVGESLGNLRAGDHFANVGTQLGCMGPVPAGATKSPAGAEAREMRCWGCMETTDPAPAPTPACAQRHVSASLPSPSVRVARRGRSGYRRRMPLAAAHCDG